MTPVIDPSFLTSGADWKVGGAESAPATETPGGFGNVLTGQISKLTDLQTQAADASQIVAGLALDARAYLLAIEPRATETIYDAYNAVAIGYSFTGRLKECYCHVAVYRKHVNLGFNRGADLDDPQEILQGKGSQVRHVTIHEKTALAGPYLKNLVRAAIVNARALGVAGGIPEIEPQSIVKAIYANRRRPT